MGNKLYEENSVQAIANAIRSKLGVETTYKINEMAGAINNIVKPSGTTNITENGYHNVTQYEQAYVHVEGGITPTGTTNIYENGDHDVTNYAIAHVAVPQPVGKKVITQNGTDIDIAQYATLDVNVQPNLGTKTVNQNGVYNASDDNLDGYSKVTVTTPVPTGKKTITENGTNIDVSSYALADVIVPQPSGKKTITQNGTNIDIAAYATADVQVNPNVGTKSININGIYKASDDNLDGYSQVIVNTPVPTGTIQIAENGTGIDIGQYQYADINVPQCGKPIIPQTGTWQYNKTWACGFIILSKDDTEDLAKYTRMMRSYNYPFTVNTTHQHYNSTVSSDADTSASTAAQAFNSYVEPVVPNGGTVKNIIDALQNYYDMNNIEISMNGTADEQLWDSSLLTGTVLDDYYTTYTTGGGTKTEEEFKEAVMTTYASRDISQGASILESKRNAFGVTYNMFPTSLSCWTGTFNIVIDNINCGTSTAVAADSTTISRSLNWYADTSFSDEQTAIIQNPYNIRKIAFEDISSSADFNDIIDWAVENRTAVELYSKINFLDGTQEKYEAIKNILQYLYEKYEDGEIYFCTRKQYYAYGKFYSNPITSVSLTVDTSLHYPTYVEVPDSAFTCMANFQDGTSSACESDRWIHKEVIDINTPGTYSVPLEYRGLFNNANVLIESPPIINYLVQNFSATISGSLSGGSMYGDLSEDIYFYKNKRYRLACHVKMGTYTAVYANHNIEFWMPDQYGNKTNTLYHFKDSTIPTTSNLELDIVVEAVFTSDYWKNKFLKVSWLNSSVSDLEITNGYIAEVGWT